MMPRLSLSAALSLTIFASIAQAGDNPPRLAVVVGANQGAGDTRPLRYAHDDARRISTLLTELGGFAADAVSLQLEPEPEAVLDALDRALEAANRDPEGALLLFYFSGHADADALYTGGARLPTSAIRARLADARATVRVGIVDACAGGEWTGTKGLVEVPVFDVSPTLSLDSEGTVLLASSSGIESAHELEHLGGSLFTHHLIAGLRGAADTERDGEVSLDEAFTYARYRTIRDAGRRVKQPQHPSFSFDLSGRRSVTLTRPKHTPGAVTLAGFDAPTDVLDLDRGTSVVDLPEADAPIRLALPPGRYLLRRLDPAQPASVEFEVIPGRPVMLTAADLVPLPPGEGRDKATRRPLPDLTVPAGAVQLGMSVGTAVFPSSSAGGWHTSGFALSSLSGRIGVTDRWAYRFPLVIAGRFGGDDFQISPAVGLNDLRYDATLGLIVPALASLDFRWFVGPRFALGAGLNGGTLFTSGGWAVGGRSSVSGRLQLTGLWSPADRWLVSLGVGAGPQWLSSYRQDDGVTADALRVWSVAIGGYGQHEPLLRFALTDAVSLTADARLNLWTADDGQQWSPSVAGQLGIRLSF